MVLIPRRFLFYVAFVLTVVPGALFVMTSLQMAKYAGDSAPARPPAVPWKKSAETLAEANDNFQVEDAAAGNTPTAGQGTGADWPQFNGANRDNISSETGLLQSWPEAGPKLDWVCRGLGVGYSSVAVVKGVVYTLGNKGTSEALIALDAGTGEKIWSTPFAGAARLSYGDGPRGTPAVSEGAVYGLGATGELVCLEAESGQVRWQQNILKTYDGAFPGWGVCESVLIDGERLICTPGGPQATLIALDKHTGKQIWKAAVPGGDRASYASPIFTEVGGIRQYVQFTSNGTVGVRADDGKFLWRDNSAANGSANCASPLAAGDLVWSASGYGTGGSLVKLTANGSDVAAELLFHTSNMKCHHGNMVLIDGLVYGSNDPGILTCIDLESGQTRWQQRSSGKDALTYADGRIYARSEEGPVALIEPTGEGYRECGRFEQPHRDGSQKAWSYPVVAEGKLFLRDQDVLLCYELKGTGDL